MYHKISGFSDEIHASVDVQFEVLNKLGIRYFEVRGVDGKNIAQLTQAEVFALKEKMEKWNIRASSIGSPIGKVRLEEPFEPHFEVFRRVVDTAKTLGAAYIRMFSFYHNGGEEWTQAERMEVLARLRRMIAYAEAHDVILLHENEKDIYGDTTARCVDLMQQLGCKHFQAVFDPANFIQCHQDTAAAYGQLKPYIAYMHIKDACGSDGHVVPAGHGDGQVPYILKDLFAGGFDGFLSLEPHLGSFEGLAALEKEHKMSNLPKGGEGTFTLAYRALCGILEDILQ